MQLLKHIFKTGYTVCGSLVFAHVAHVWHMCGTWVPVVPLLKVEWSVCGQWQSGLYYQIVEPQESRQVEKGKGSVVYHPTQPLSFLWPSLLPSSLSLTLYHFFARSEERRVWKEFRSRWSRYH